MQQSDLCIPIAKTLTMAVALEQFVKQLEDSGVLAGDTLREFLPPRAAPKDAEDLARELIRHKKLTKFQAEMLWIGQGKSLILGNYVLLEKIGQGGMGAVYKAEHRRMQRTVAIKILPPAMMKDSTASTRFQREVVAAAKLEHQNIVAAYDADQANGIHFLVMQYVEGSDLSALVKKNGPLPVAQAINSILQAARGLEFAHKKGVVHRDIKPANLLLGTDGVLKILDMGLARIEGDTAGQAELTGSYAVMGTVDYMAPEQARSTKHADARADIYSLGCSLFYLFTGKATYDGDTLTSKLLAHQNDPIPSLRSVRADVPEQVEAVFRKMVAKKIEDRYQTMADVIADLEKCSSGQVVNMPPPVEISDDGLTDFLKDLPASSPTIRGQTQAARANTRNGKKQLLMVGGSVVGVLILLAGLLSSFKTNDGKLIVKVNEPDAEVQVLNAAGKVEITRKGTKEPMTVSVAPGRHRLKVIKDGFTDYGQDFEIEAGGRKPITVQLAPRQDQPVVARSKKSLAFKTPWFDQWLKKVTPMPAEQQLEAVRSKLMEVNPGFDGKFDEDSYRIRDWAVWRLAFFTDNVTDISPLRAFTGLNHLTCRGSTEGQGRLRDLSPLAGMAALTELACDDNPKLSDLAPLRGLALTGLSCCRTEVSDLSPLQGTNLQHLNIRHTSVTDLSGIRGLPLEDIHCADVRVSDLSPLAGMKLRGLWFYNTQVSDLSPLKGMPLTNLNFGNTPVSDLSALKGMPLTELSMDLTRVSDLSVLQGMPLETLYCNGAVTDLSPLRGMPLKFLYCDFKPERDADILRSIKTLETINHKPAAEFWKEVEKK